MRAARSLFRSLNHAVGAPRLALGFFALVLGVIYSAIIPPIQSPDEAEHLKRAYLLSRGVLTFYTPASGPSGGYVATALLEFIDVHSSIPFRPNRKYSERMVDEARTIFWSEEERFVPITASPNFPLVYFPASIGLLVGRGCGLSVEHSYRLARFLTTSTSVGIIMLALTIHPSNPLSLFILTLPMSVFQFVSVSADAISYALTLLISSVGVVGLDAEKKYSPFLAILLGVSLFALVSGRWQLAPMIFLPLLIWLKRKRKLDFLAFLIALSSVFWIFYTLDRYVDARVVRELPTEAILSYYLSRPAETLGIFWNTLTKEERISFYYHSFIGRLGWLDTLLPSPLYRLAFFFLLLFFGLSFSVRNVRQDYKLRLVFFLISIAILLISLAGLLVFWSPFPTKLIFGVQGRYFAIPVILMSYVLSGSSDLRTPLRLLLTKLAFFVWILVEAHYMTVGLIFRYLVR
ncbi:MAG: DUF2142 domain-containing protein [Anaerolineales bacterium]|nr:DUF2142 domain-containing protein [Anaerolineales bacterium]MDW8161178.1 DUF2142 domain-containing protein [Anaerolineales bacterium]